jgi:hypothetical protein
MQRSLLDSSNFEKNLLIVRGRGAEYILRARNRYSIGRERILNEIDSYQLLNEPLKALADFC